MNRFDPVDYGPLAAAVLADERLPELGPGAPNEAARPLLDQLSPETLLTGRPVRDLDMARCCMAALWLHHDFLDESHAISQEIGTAEGSYWHGIMHRREPDPDNARYWFRRVGAHPVLDQLRRLAPLLGYEFATAPAFIDFCERVRGAGSAEETMARRVQLLEWQLHFDWCWRRATGAAGRD